MHLRAILAIARKDTLDVLVNRSTLVGLLTPIFLAVLFAFLNQVIGTTTSDILVYNPSNSPLQQAIGSGLSHPRYVLASSADEVMHAFGADGTKHSSSYAVGLVIPADFEGALQQGQRPSVQLFVNGDRSSPQQRDLLTAVITTYSRRVAAPTDPVQIQSAMINPPDAKDSSLEIGNFYAAAAVMSSFFIGMSLVANMLVEEREKKTLRMLLVSPASLVDIIIGKSGVALGYQLLVSLLALTITGGINAHLPLTLAFVIIGTLFTLVLGLLVAGLFQSTSAVGAFSGVASFIFIVPIFFVFPLFGTNGNVVVTLIKLLPTFYIADGIYRAISNSIDIPSLAIDLAVGLGTVVVIFALAVWALRRQAIVTASV